jgi:hypothetical protein
VLSATILLLLTFNSLVRSRFSEITYFILGLYVAYSFLLYAFTHWVGVSRAAGLTALSGDPSDVFAARQWGLVPGFRITLLTAILLLSVGVPLGHGEVDFSFRHVLMGPTMLLVINYMTAI